MLDERKAWPGSSTASYDRRVSAFPPKPGLAKTQGLPFLRQRCIRLWQGSDHFWRQLLESADTMSEGAVRDEAGGRVYYGSTSIVLPVASRGGLVPDQDRETISKLLAYDVHARVRALRVACLEARLRCSEPLGKVSADIEVGFDESGIRARIDVEAPALDESQRVVGE